MGIFAAHAYKSTPKKASIYFIAAYGWIMQDNYGINAAFLSYFIDFAALRLTAIH